MTVVTSLVAVLMLYLLPNRQQAELEKSIGDELSGLAVAYSVSVRSALDRQDLSVLAALNEQVATDPRNPIVAIIDESEGDKRIFAYFPASEEIVSVDQIYSAEFLSVERSFASNIFEGTLVVMFK